MDDPPPPPIDDEEVTSLLRTLSALAQPTRLRVYLDLLAALPAAKPSGEIAASTGTPPTTMSAHLAVLGRAGLVSSERRGTSILYAADPTPARRLVHALRSVQGD